MKITDKIKSTLNKLTSRRRASADNDSELAADEVIEKEVYPPKRCNAKKKSGSSTRSKKPSERTRPTNSHYQMIDTTDESCDTSKS